MVRQGKGRGGRCSTALFISGRAVATHNASRAYTKLSARIWFDRTTGKSLFEPISLRQLGLKQLNESALGGLLMAI
jgi:hypothetical protein